MGEIIIRQPQDLLIGATALHLGYEVATLNLRDFRRIPGLWALESFQVIQCSQDILAL